MEQSMFGVCMYVPVHDIWSLLSEYPVVQPQWKAPGSL